MNPPNWIEVTALTNYEVAPDGSSVKLNVLDAGGRDASFIVPLGTLRALALSLPGIVLQAARCASGGGDTLRLVHDVAHWKIERATDPEYAILTLMTPDRFELSFSIKDATLAQMAELMSEFHIEAFPDGLQFH